MVKLDVHKLAAIIMKGNNYEIENTTQPRKKIPELMKQHCQKQQSSN